MLYTLSEHRIKLCEVAFANRLLHEKGGHKFDGALGGDFFSPQHVQQASASFRHLLKPRVPLPIATLDTLGIDV